MVHVQQPRLHSKTKERKTLDTRSPRHLPYQQLSNAQCQGVALQAIAGNCTLPLDEKTGLNLQVP